MTDRAREIALGNTILRTRVGSGLYGTGLDGQEDNDEMGICIEPPSCIIGLEKVPTENSKGDVKHAPFAQYQYRDQPAGVRSQPGDLELTIYGLRKWASEAADGNPNLLQPLFAPIEFWTEWNHHGLELQLNRDMFISKLCGERFIGYLTAQWHGMLGQRSRRTNRPELIQEYGFDTKFAYHAVRLGIQGVELISTGTITYPIPEPHRTWLKELRVGKHNLGETVELIEDLREELRGLTAAADLPATPDWFKINSWLVATYQHWWRTSS
ncbi:nucleotidyltransferase domain-containing protein [Mycolicibacterium sp. S2-37]|uniref:DNA polymerase beta superfamily protein n=1 Tax=Mycolicibacterium sp. S2-37 TaxID=2810297 RepID=UPI001A940EF4|nr:nucleotidyltransferase domain-containing protein [Mycolicibacterium sp. S2-37]MBO0676731.1 nucleotidyltransferase domain-containing protein [Mycolicibacterium sp. S2-37]